VAWRQVEDKDKVEVEDKDKVEAKVEVEGLRPGIR